MGETGPPQRAPQAGKPWGRNQVLTLSHANQRVHTRSPAHGGHSKGPSWLIHSVYTLTSVAGLDGVKPRRKPLPAVPRHPQPLCTQRQTTAEATTQKGQNETCVPARNWRRGYPDPVNTEKPVATGRGAALVQILPAAAPARRPGVGQGTSRQACSAPQSWARAGARPQAAPQGTSELLFPLFNIYGCPFFFAFLTGSEQQLIKANDHRTILFGREAT